MSTSPQYLSTVQAGERLGISREHVRRLIQRGELRATETVNGFMLDVDEVERYASQRRVLQDQRQFNAAVDDLASLARRMREATGITSAVVQLRDAMKTLTPVEIPQAVVPQLKWIEELVGTRQTLADLLGPTQTVAEAWHRFDEDARRAMEQTFGLGTHANQVRQIADMFGRASLVDQVDRLARGFSSGIGQIGVDDPGVTAPSEGRGTPGLALGFVVPEPHEARLEEKMDELNRKVERLAEVVIQRHADTATEMPTWQRWAGSDRPEDVLAKLDAVREEVTGGKRIVENSTDIIRKSREARGQDG
ncbi:MAG: excisionase family DNA-binding protein [Thermomicrobia bacterium]|nr:excisionase family DNA-binding protein [Thermomicrobia bacterium]MCA1725001.1 excisionase family DNA-binding protein [Thermomicrobia bacterium]